MKYFSKIISLFHKFLKNSVTGEIRFSNAYHPIGLQPSEIGETPIEEIKRRLEEAETMAHLDEY
ncbi:MAG: hypothetical protein DRO96_02375 [Candidatus Aenigmatarchaeota archaeon]|nr:MAG: hypothetical protein DRO96_02375 [Candidatus Aenigmarchaeota archaeon]